MTSYRLSGTLWGAALALFTVLPAHAAGPLAHLVVAERCFPLLVSTQPWLAPHRDAFYWGSLAGDWNSASGSPHVRRERPNTDEEVQGLWQKAELKGPLQCAFVLGWSVHVATNETQTIWLKAQDREERLLAIIKLPTDTGNVAPAADLALDAALLPGASRSLKTMAQVARGHSTTPAGGAIQQMLREEFAIDEAAYLNWAGLLFLAGARGADAYLALRARHVHLETLAPLLTGAVGRSWAADPREFLADAAQSGFSASQRLLSTAQKR